MISSYRRVMALALAILFLSGCASNPIEGLPDIGVSTQEINSRIHLWIFGSENTAFKIKNGESMMVGVDVKSPDHVAFARDYGVRLFLNEEGKWKEIKNETAYDESLPEVYVIPAEGYLIKSGGAVVTPYYPNLEKSTKLRIVVIGRLVRDGKVTEEKTAGSIDILLEP